MHQQEALRLIEALCEEGYTVLVETSGAIDISPVDQRAHVILDVKCPGSGMMDRMDWDNIGRVTAKDEVKFVIRDRVDYEWAVSILRQYELERRCTVLFGPVFGDLDLRQLAEWILARQAPGSLSDAVAQVHLGSLYERSMTKCQPSVLTSASDC